MSGKTISPLDTLITSTISSTDMIITTTIDAINFFQPLTNALILRENIFVHASLMYVLLLDGMQLTTNVVDLVFIFKEQHQQVIPLKGMYY